jgi:hypothetical protein
MASGINDHGWIVGSAQNAKLGIEHAFLLTPVPESGERHNDDHGLRDDFHSGSRSEDKIGAASTTNQHKEAATQARSAFDKGKRSDCQTFGGSDR